METSNPSSSQPPLKPYIKGERRYPCGFPGCKWIFTRSNHVLRHHQRVHPGYKGSTSALSNHSSPGSTVSSNIPNNSNSIECLPIDSQYKGVSTTTSGHTVILEEGMTEIPDDGEVVNQDVKEDDDPLIEPEVLLEVDESQVWDPNLHSSNHPTKRFAKLEDMIDNDNDVSSSSFPETDPQDLRNIPSSNNMSTLYQQLLLSKVAAANNLIPSSSSSNLFAALSMPSNSLLATSTQAKVYSVPSSTTVATKPAAGLLDKQLEENWLSRHRKPFDNLRSVSDKSNFEASSIIQAMMAAVRDSGSTSPPSAQHPQPPPINLIDRPYVCEYPGCRWSFKRQYHLDRHFLTHRTGNGSNSGGETARSESDGNYSRRGDSESNDESPPVIAKTSIGTSLLSYLPLNLKTESSTRPYSMNQPEDLSRNTSQARSVQQRTQPQSHQPMNLTSRSNTFQPIRRPVQPIISGNNKQKQPSQEMKIPQKGVFTCNYPGCGIKCQSQSSFDAHVYLTHIVMNPNRVERNRRNAAAAANRNLAAQQKQANKMNQTSANNRNYSHSFQSNSQSTVKRTFPVQQLTQQNAVVQSRQQTQQRVQYNPSVNKKPALSSSESLSLLASIASQHEKCKTIQEKETSCLIRASSSQQDKNGESNLTPEALQLYNFSLANLMSAVQQQQSYNADHNESGSQVLEEESSSPSSPTSSLDNQQMACPSSDSSILKKNSRK